MDGADAVSTAHRAGDLALPIRTTLTDGLTAAELRGLRELFRAAWPDSRFDDHDFEHAMGGRHWLITLDRRIVCHASVVPRTLWVAGRALRTGYVEAVATLPAFENRGLGSAVVRGAGDHIRASYELGALSTGRHSFYERLGWRTWLGHTFVRSPSYADGGDPAEVMPTAGDDGSVLVLATPASPPLELDGSLVCDWRAGDVW
jgi:aminoglycoside 2'-N-acetyltransferase I